MNRTEFMKQLEVILQDIAENERVEALQFYEDYFDDAGPENEDKVLAELKSPHKVAEIIKSGLNSSGPEGEFTETGYQDEILSDSGQLPERTEQPFFNQETGGAEGQTAGSENNTEYSNAGPNAGYNNAGSNAGYNNAGPNARYNNAGPNTGYNNGSNTGYGNTGYRNAGNGRGTYGTHTQQGPRYEKDNSNRTLWIILACIFAIPVGIPLLAVVFSFIVAGIAIVAAIGLTVVILTIVAFVIGIAFVVAGFTQIIAYPGFGILFIGMGLVSLAVGVVMAIICILCFVKAFPSLIRGIVNMGNKIFRRGGSYA